MILDLSNCLTCLSCSRRTGHYTVQQSQNTHHGDRYGPTISTSTDPPSLPNPSVTLVPKSQPSSSPRHSPNCKKGSRPSSQRCNSQVSRGVNLFNEQLHVLVLFPKNTIIVNHLKLQIFQSHLYYKKKSYQLN